MRPGDTQREEQRAACAMPHAIVMGTSKEKLLGASSKLLGTAMSRPVLFVRVFVFSLRSATQQMLRLPTHIHSPAAGRALPHPPGGLPPRDSGVGPTRRKRGGTSRR